MKKILVTGSCGFIASNFIRKSIHGKAPYTFSSIDNMSDENAIHNKYFNQLHNFYLGNLSDKNILDKIFTIDKPEIVIHTAHDKNDIVNIELTNNLVEVCNLHNVKKIIYFSTYKVYGQVDSDKFPEETNKTNTTDLFAYSKLACEDLLRLKFKNDLVILRLCNVYGIRQSKEYLIPNTINKILNSETIELEDKGENLKQWLSLPDFYKLLYKVLETDVKGIYNIGSNQEYTNVEVVQHICNLMESGHNLIKLIDKNKDYKSLGCNYNKAKQELGFLPDTKLKYDDVLIDWYKKNQWFFK